RRARGRYAGGLRGARVHGHPALGERPEVPRPQLNQPASMTPGADRRVSFLSLDRSTDVTTAAAVRPAIELDARFKYAG
ncbi:hypothetical protein J7E95_41565, partial [Streptomyces sp. ISL-14]|nr:hypothetical protein [Streptomyces sp. ISL-14]